jgi:spore coat polysaccharide biosynthesis protein SpsF
MFPPVLIIVQARMGGSRFPGKVAASLLGQPMLLWQLDRLSRVQTPHHLVVACPNDSPNQEIVRLCARHGYDCISVPVPEQDVLSRFAWVAEHYEASEIVRCTGDCPLFDPLVVDWLIGYHRRRTPSPDHTGLAAQWPDGTDCDMTSRSALGVAHAEARTASDREHVVSWLWSQPQRFCLATLPCPFDLSGLQFSVDTPYDLQMVERLLEYVLDAVGPDFGYRDLWRMVQRHNMLRDWQRYRPLRNHAYLQQVGAKGKTWEEVRYGESPLQG